MGFQWSILNLLHLVLALQHMQGNYSQKWHNEVFLNNYSSLKRCYWRKSCQIKFIIVPLHQVIKMMEPWLHMDYTCGPSQALFSLGLKRKAGIHPFHQVTFSSQLSVPKSRARNQSFRSSLKWLISLRIRAVSMVSLLRLMFELVVFNFFKFWLWFLYFWCFIFYFFIWHVSQCMLGNCPSAFACSVCALFFFYFTLLCVTLCCNPSVLFTVCCSQCSVVSVCISSWRHLKCVDIKFFH